MLQVISLLLENKPGALMRVTGLLSQRGYNIESLTVARTLDPELSEYFADRYFAQAERLSADRLTTSLERLAALEFSIKNGTVGPASLELLIVDLTGGAISRQPSAVRR